MQNEIRGETQIIDGSIPLAKTDPTVFTSGAAGAIFTDKEDHSSECDGSNQTFVLGHESFPGSEHVFWRGTLRRQCDTSYPVMPTNAGEYWLDTTTFPGSTRIILVVAPDTGDDLVISYRNKYGT